MNMFFTKIGQELYDIIGDQENNTVKHAHAKVFAEGGAVYGEDGIKLTEGNPLGDDSLISKIGTSLTKGIGSSLTKSADAYGKSFRDTLSTGHFIHNNFGTFFKGGDPGGTNSAMKAPVQGKAPQSVNPSDFYAQWYMDMRRFAEASELAQRGQTTTRTR